MKIQIDGIEVEGEATIQHMIERADASAAEKMTAEKSRADAAEKSVKSLETERDTLRADRDAHKKRADEGEAEAAKPMMKCDKCDGSKMVDGAECDKCKGAGEVPKMDAAGKVKAWIDRAIASGVKSRAALMDAARPHLPVDFKADAATDLDVKRAVVANLDGRDVASEPAAYVERRYAIAIEEAAKRADGKPKRIDLARPPIHTPPAAPRKDGKTRQRDNVVNAWQTPGLK